jgi:hypothetical protein
MVCVWVVAKEGRLCTLLNAAEEDFWSVGSQIGATKHFIVDFEDTWCWLAIYCPQLIEYVDNTLFCMSTLNGGVV